MSATRDEAKIGLTTPIEGVRGIGPRRGAAFRALGIPSVAHLVHHIPSRHEFEAAEGTIAQAAAGAIVTVRGEVASTRVAGRRARQRFEAILEDDTGRVMLVWFNQPYLRQKIHPGTKLRVRGKARAFENYLQLANPLTEIIREEAPAPDAKGDRLRPVYPASEEINSAAIEEAVAAVLDDALPLIEDHLPEAFRRERELPELCEAYRMLHRPARDDEPKAARRRLAYDELLLLQLALHIRRRERESNERAPSLKWSAQIDARIRALLPFALTPGQEGAVRDVAANLQRATPANRLVQGDVGSGKTVVALYAMLMAAASQRQGALMAPTELLAEQHFLSISELLKGSKVRAELLTGSMPARERAGAEARIASGESRLVIGTHSLLTESVAFDSLGVVVIDEQHRFGVHQRARLGGKAGASGETPHVLIMTATPIPRTLSLTVFGDLDVSVIKGLPPGRTPVRTRVAPLLEASDAYSLAKRRIEEGRQVYVVVPAIDTGGERGLRDLRTTLDRLEKGILQGKRIAPLHGRMKREERASVMERFRRGEINCLVATTVIEVGVDVPNASLMIVEHAERFGLAQLHQLRGRVGRGAHESECVLLAEATTDDAAARLEAIESTTDGFDLAEQDLAIRGPGDFIGARQSGAAPFRVVRFPDDMELLLMARRDAAAWIDRSPTLGWPEEALLRKRLMKAYKRTLGLAGVA